MCFCVTFCAPSLCQDPAAPNGRIQRFLLRIQGEGDAGRGLGGKDASEPSVGRSHGDAGAITELTELQLDDGEAVTVYVAAENAVGRSPEAELAISSKEAHRE